MADGIGALACILGACKISYLKIVMSVENGLATCSGQGRCVEHCATLGIIQLDPFL